MKLRQAAVASLWISCVAVIAHLLYSKLGINLIDDGFTLAYARRLLDGQIPHRDFIIIRPALSPLLHVPEVLFGGPYTFWLSRLVFFLQSACIAWFGTAFINKNMGTPFSLFVQSALALVAFMFGCHSFPLMAWHTIDGLFLCVLGFWLRGRSSGTAGLAGYVLLGAACLCKQNFIFVAPGALLIFGDWRKWKCVLASVLPGLLYVAYLLGYGAFHDGVQQLLAQTGIFRVGVWRYKSIGFFMGMTGGLIVANLFYRESTTGSWRSRTIRRAIGIIWLAIFFLLALGSLHYEGFNDGAVTAFGMVCGALGYWILEGGSARIGEIQTGSMVALLAWSASLSLGYKTPALASGLLITFLFSFVYERIAWNGLYWRPLAALAAALIVMPAFHYTRTHSIYREQPASQLTYSLDGVLPGARLIRTNPNTYAFLTDLNVAIEKAATNGLPYAILPEIAAYWVKAEQSNPLPIDWAKTTELSTKPLVERVIQSLERQRSKQVVLVQKVTANALQDGFHPLEGRGRKFAVATYVETHFEKIDETQYFDLYR